MAQVLLTRLWLHRASDLSDFVLVVLGDESEQIEQPVAVRRYAQGRMRAITRPGKATTLKFRLGRTSRDTYQELVDRIGTLLLLRDPRGRKMWGIIDGVDADEWRARNMLQPVSFTFTMLSVSEAV